MFKERQAPEGRVGMSVYDSALQGALFGAIGGGIGIVLKLIFRRPKSGSAGSPELQASAVETEDNRTIVPIRLPEALNLKPGDLMEGAQGAEAGTKNPREGKEPAVEEIVGWVLLKTGPDKGERYDLIPGEIRVGRSENCAIRLNGDEEVSREHAMIRVQPRECILCDLGSRNGTFLNGSRVGSPRRLQEGDMLRVGGAEMVFIRA